MNREEMGPIIHKLDHYITQKDYKGYCKFDALNSPLLEKCCGKSTLLRLVATQVINRIPLNLRAIFGVEGARNPKGIANFIKGYCALYRATKDKIFYDKAISLGHWLLENSSDKKKAFQGKGLAFGYHFPWQSPGFYAPRHYPNCIVTTFCGEAFLSLFEISKDPLFKEAAIGVSRFILEELPILEETPDSLCIGYVNNGPKWKVININAVTAGFLSKVALITQDKNLLLRCKKMIEWVSLHREENYSWNYTYPKKDAGIGPDNYHTGGILDGIHDYMQASQDNSYLELYQKGLQFYKEHLFTPQFAPKWRDTKDYPYDVHGSAQGILTFVRTDIVTAKKIMNWAQTHLWSSSEGRFYYQKYRYFTWKIDLMRWNNSWMFWAMAELYTHTVKGEK